MKLNLNAIAEFFRPWKNQGEATSFRESLEQDSRLFVLPASVLAMFVWLPFVHVDNHLHEQELMVVYLRLGLSLVGSLAFIGAFIPFFKRHSYWLVFFIVGYAEFSGAVIVGMVRADPVYVAGLFVVVLVVPLVPLKRSHLLMLLGAACVLFSVTALLAGIRFNTWTQKYQFFNLLAVVSIAFIAILLLDTHRTRRHKQSLLIKKHNDELEASSRKIQLINRKLEHSSIELSRTNEELRKANEIKSSLLGVAAHDLRNPLQVIMAHTELLKRKLGETDDSCRRLDMIHQSSDKILKLITELLQTAIIEKGELKLKKVPLDAGNLADVVVRVNQPLADRKNQHIIFSAEGIFMIDADKVFMQQVMENLLSNAIKFSQRGKRIWVSVEREGDKILYRVQDEGPGLTADDKTRLFGRFQRLSAKPTGDETSTGLGLSIIHDLVELHMGDIQVDSEPGKGSTFTVALPASTAPEQGNHNHGTHGQNGKNGRYKGISNGRSNGISNGRSNGRHNGKHNGRTNGKSNGKKSFSRRLRANKKI